MYMHSYIIMLCISILYTGGLIEKYSFKKFFSQLVSMLPTTNITHLLVSAQIITTDDIEEINGMSRSKEKSSYVLRIVAKSLEIDITTSFYALLDVRENYGSDITALTNDIRSALIESSGNLASDVHYV